MIDIRPRIPCCASLEFGVKRRRVVEDAPVRSQLRRPPPGAITGAGSGILAPGILILAPHCGS